MVSGGVPHSRGNGDVKGLDGDRAWYRMLIGTTRIQVLTSITTACGYSVRCIQDSE